MHDIATSNSLADLAARIRAEHEAAVGAQRTSLTHAMAAGDLLIEAKAQLDHGQWLPWLKSCGISERTGQRYIRLARNRDTIEAKYDKLSDLSVSAALGLLAVQRCSNDAARWASFVGNAADSALGFWEAERLDEWDRGAERSKQRALLAEADAAVERVAELVTTSELADIVNAETDDAASRFIEAFPEYTAAVAAQMGLTTDELERVANEIGAIKLRDGDRSEILRCVLRYLDREPRPGPSPTVALQKIRDLANAWLRQVEQIVVRVLAPAPAAANAERAP
jgi:DUF3102 family protein